MHTSNVSNIQHKLMVSGGRSFNKLLLFLLTGVAYVALDTVCSLVIDCLVAECWNLSF